MDNQFSKKLSSLGEISKMQLSKVLNSISGRKDLHLDKSLIKPLEKICGARWLKSNGIDKIFKIEDNHLPVNTNAQLFIIYSVPETFNKVIDLIRSQLDSDNPVKNKYHILTIPRVLAMFEETLEELGLYAPVVQIYSFLWQPIYLDSGILSLEVPDMFKNIYVLGDYTLLQSYSKSLWHLFFVLGKPKLTLALGQMANAVLSQYLLFCEEQGATDKLNSEIGAVVLMDRNVDYPSSLLTPGTYTALLKEVYTVKCGVCEHKIEDEAASNKLPISFNLDSKRDSVYNNIKNRYFTQVTNVLSNLTKQLRLEGESSKEMALDEIKMYVKTKLQDATNKKKQISNHLQAAECIINTLGHRFEKQQFIEQSILQNQNKSNNFAYLEEIISTENDKLTSLRLMCLMSLTQKLSENELKSFWRKYMIEYGYKYGYVYNNMINAGFIPEPSANPSKIINIPKLTANNFYTNANKLKQVPPDPDSIDLKAPTSCSYVFAGGYLPLISVISSMLINNISFEEIKAKLEPLAPLTFKNEAGYPLETRSLLVCIIGGITYAEIAACNLLSTLTQTKITFLTDKVISGNDIIDALF